ncbi:IS3 family transposase [Myxococcus dinghuensis]|uniref:IS3 family transposase n=1 Tax=Myxococcus dinghuensis TaxID=2906761 RepID=UPI0038993557
MRTFVPSKFWTMISPPFRSTSRTARSRAPASVPASTMTWRPPGTPPFDVSWQPNRAHAPSRRTPRATTEVCIASHLVRLIRGRTDTAARSARAHALRGNVAFLAVRVPPRYGYRRIRIFLGRDGHRMCPDRAYRLWKKEGLQVPRKRSRRRVASSRPRPLSATGPNQV